MSAQIIPFSGSRPPEPLARESITQPPTAAPAVLTVKVEYLHHTGPHFRDTAERKAEKARVSELARQNERTFTCEYPKPVSRWTASDILTVLDAIRAQMPTAAPDGGSGVPLHWMTLPDEQFRDGRALNHLAFHHTAMSRQAFWLSTAAGYSVRVELDGPLPPAALIPFSLGMFGMEVEITLDRRAARAWAKAIPPDGRKGA